MEDMNQRTDRLNKTTDKIVKMVEKLDTPDAFSVINFCFTKLAVERLKNPILAKAALVTFLQNTGNTIDEFYGDDDYEEESIH